MQALLLMGFFGFLILIIFQFGIEPALTVGTLISGLVWLGYRLAKGKSEKGAEQPSVIEYARSFFPIFLAVLVLRSFLAEPFRIPSGSMMPTLLIGDFILTNKFAYGLRLPVTHTKIVPIGEPHRGDVVVFRYPNNPRLDYIKRVIGLPGDHIAYKNKHIYINGKPQPIKIVGPYTPVGSGMRELGTVLGVEQLGKVKHDVLLDPMKPSTEPGCNFLGSQGVTVPKGHYFMMGDNRDDSNDGRCWGFVPEQNLVGKAFMIWFSLDPERPGVIAWHRIGDLIN